MISKLSNVFAPSGCENEVQNIIKANIDNPNFEVSTDKLGNIIAKSPHNDACPTVLVISHMDEPCIIATSITDDGYLKFDTIGDISVDALVSKRVKSPKVEGIIALKAIHLIAKDERGKPAELRDLYIDIGAKSKAEALKYVTEGDCFTFSTDFEKLGDDKVKGKSLGRSISTSALIDLINHFNLSNINLIGLFTTQKEIGARGLKTALNSIDNVDLAIVLDTLSVSELNNTTIKVGEGAVLGFVGDMTDVSLNLTKKIKDITDGLHLEYAHDRSCLDGIIAKRADIPAILLSVPCKNKETCLNIASTKDINKLNKALNNILSEVRNGKLV